MPSAVDPALIEAWLRARSLSRALPQPIPDSGGLRVDSGLPNETRRYLFATPVDGLREIAERVREPQIPLKLCDTPDVMRSYLPPRWEISPSNFVMTCRGAFARRENGGRLPAGYRLELQTHSHVTHAEVHFMSGEIAASGYAARYGDVCIYDRILTSEHHRRKGLGTVIMSALASACPASADIQILVATPAGRELYRTFGWTDYALYTSAAIPKPR